MPKSNSHMKTQDRREWGLLPPQQPVLCKDPQLSTGHSEGTLNTGRRQQFRAANYELHLPSTSRESNYKLLQPLTFNTHRRSSGWRSGMRHSVLWGKLAEQVFRYLGIFGRRFLWAQFWPLLKSRKALKIINGDICLPGGSDGKKSTCNAGDPGLISG